MQSHIQFMLYAQIPFHYLFTSSPTEKVCFWLSVSDLEKGLVIGVTNHLFLDYLFGHRAT